MRQVVLVGGLHGTGKTTLCQSYCIKSPGWTWTKQRYLLSSVSGVDWPEVAARHHELMPAVANAIFVILSSGLVDGLLIDCHYAIATSQALRPHQSKHAYIPDLDPVLVKQLIGSGVSVRATLLHAPVEICRGRVIRRDGYFENELGFRKKAMAEREFFEGLDVPQKFSVDTDRPPEFVLSEFDSLIAGGSG